MLRSIHANLDVLHPPRLSTMRTWGIFFVIARKGTHMARPPRVPRPTRPRGSLDYAADRSPADMDPDVSITIDTVIDGPRIAGATIPGTLRRDGRA